jgi:hypothetical protein
MFIHISSRFISYVGYIPETDAWNIPEKLFGRTGRIFSAERKGTVYIYFFSF